jgi:hypothetical protein
MDNRVSKSIVRLIPAIVKEQRVDGSGLVENYTSLRYTLTGFERNSNINILSNQMFKRFYSNIIINKSDFLNTESPVDP